MGACFLAGMALPIGNHLHRGMGAEEKMLDLAQFVVDETILHAGSDLFKVTDCGRGLGTAYARPISMIAWPLKLYST